MTVATTPRTHRQPSSSAEPVTTEAPPSQWPWLGSGLVLAFLGSLSPHGPDLDQPRPLLSLVFTAVYHLGYSDFRGGKVRKPLAGDVIWSAPTLVTLSPFGSPITHAGLHVTAVIHSYTTDTFLPPHAATGTNKRVKGAAMEVQR
jgi:hypothetical protein